jgi:hypothetical protein
MTESEILECGFDEGMFRVQQFMDDGFVVLGYYVNAFYLQDNWLQKLWKRLIFAGAILLGFEYRLFDLTIDNNEDLNRFKAFVAQMRPIKDDNQ